MGMEVDMEPSWAQKLEVNHWHVAQQDAVAEDLWTLTLQLLSKRAASQSWYSDYYPGMFALLLHPDEAVVEEFLHVLKTDYDAFAAASKVGHPTRFTEAMVAGSPFQTAFVM
eukprot:7581073-Lingulodinium_polyedra.AAC.1